MGTLSKFAKPSEWIKIESRRMSYNIYLSILMYYFCEKSMMVHALPHRACGGSSLQNSIKILVSISLIFLVFMGVMSVGGISLPVKKIKLIFW